MKAIVIHEFGGPEVLTVEDAAEPVPADGEVRLRHTFVGVNFADHAMRQGIYFMVPDLPAIIGLEGAGVIEELGPGVSGFEVGQRVAYVGALGSYAEQRTIAAASLFAIPDGVSDEMAGSSLLRGMTVHYLVRLSYPLKAGETALVHSAAGGVGSLLTQYAKHIGATVIGTVSSAAKAEIAKQNGCDHVINYGDGGFAEAVNKITGGDGVQVVYDAVGKDTFDGNLDCLAVRGYFINYGASSGPLPMVDPKKINAKSLFFNKSSLIHYTRDRQATEGMAADVFELMGQGVLAPAIGHCYPLADAAQAHRDIAGRKTTGSVVLKV